MSPISKIKSGPFCCPVVPYREAHNLGCDKFTIHGHVQRSERFRCKVIVCICSFSCVNRACAGRLHFPNHRLSILVHPRHKHTNNILKTLHANDLRKLFYMHFLKCLIPASCVYGGGAGYCPPVQSNF